MIVVLGIVVAVGVAVARFVRMAVVVRMIMAVFVGVIMPVVVRMCFLVGMSVAVIVFVRMPFVVGMDVIEFVGSVGVLVVMVMPAPRPMRMPMAVATAAGAHGLPTRLQQPAANDDDHQSAHQRQPDEDAFHEEVLRCIEGDQAQHEHRGRVRHRDDGSEINRVPDGAARSRQVGSDDGFAVTRRQRVRRPRQEGHAEGDRNEAAARVLHRQQAFELFADGVMPIRGLRPQRGRSQQAR